MNNIIILQHQKTLCFSPFNLTVQSGHQFCPKSENLVFKQDDFLSLNILSYLHFLLLIKSKKVQSKKQKHFLSRTHHSLGSFLPVRILSLISVKTTEGHM